MADMRTHHSECFRTHLSCAEAEVDRLRAILDATARPAPLEEAAPMGVLGWAQTTVARLARHASAWDHDPGPSDDDCDEDCRACECEALLRTGRAALAARPAQKAETLEEDVLEAIERLRAKRFTNRLTCTTQNIRVNAERELMEAVDALLAALAARPGGPR